MCVLQKNTDGSIEQLLRYNRENFDDTKSINAVKEWSIRFLFEKIVCRIRTDAIFYRVCEAFAHIFKMISLQGMRTMMIVRVVLEI